MELKQASLLFDSIQDAQHIDKSAKKIQNFVHNYPYEISSGITVMFFLIKTSFKNVKKFNYYFEIWENYLYSFIGIDNTQVDINIIASYIQLLIMCYIIKKNILKCNELLQKMEKENLTTIYSKLLEIYVNLIEKKDVELLNLNNSVKDVINLDINPNEKFYIFIVNQLIKV